MIYPQIPDCPGCKITFDLNDHIPRILLPCCHSICTQCLKNTLRVTEKVECPEDGKFFIARQRSIEVFSVNHALCQILDMKSKLRYCTEHEENQRLICLDDGEIICDDCVHVGRHRGHSTKSIKKVQAEANEKSKVLEDAYKELGEYEANIVKMLDARRSEFLKISGYRFDSLRQILTLKESQVRSDISDFFINETEKIKSKIGAFSPLKKGIEEKIKGLEDVCRLPNPLDTWSKETAMIAWKIDHLSFDKQLDETSVFFQQSISKFNNDFLQCSQEILKLLFPVDELRDQVEKFNIDDDDHTVNEDFEVFGELFATKDITLNMNDETLVISTRRDCDNDTNLGNNEILPSECKDINKVYLYINRKMLSGDNLLTLLSIRDKIDNMTELTLNFLDKTIIDQELALFWHILFLNTKGLEKIKISLEACSYIGNPGILPFLTNILPNISTLKCLEINLKGTIITDHALEALAYNNSSILKNLETFGMSLYKTPITDKALSQAFTNMENLKLFSLDLQSTKVTSNGIQAFATNDLTNMKALRTFELFLANSKVEDQGVLSLFGGIKHIKDLKINLSNLKVTDRSIGYFAVHVLPAMKNLESLELHLGLTGITDESVTMLVGNLPALKRLGLGLRCTKISNKVVDAFKYNTRLFKSMDEFDIDVEETFISNQEALTGIKQQMSQVKREELDL